MEAAPDCFGTEPQRGWRVWRFDTWTERLTSPYFQDHWPPFARAEVECHDFLSPSHVGGEGSPTLECSCGFYAHTSFDVMLEEHNDLCAGHPVNLRRRVPVIGRVSLWGRLVEHDYGWRGRFAYPYEILVPKKLPSGSYDPQEVMTMIRNAYCVDTAVL